jgi:hypothetical protein
VARRIFLSETYPGAAVFGEQPPGPGWIPATGATTDPKPSPVKVRVSLTDVIDALTAAMPAQESPGEAFHRLAELRSRAEGVSLAEAYRRQSASTPELWEDVRNAAPRGH